MKYGIVVFGDSNNIGDDIQSYAAMCRLPRVDYVLDRESLDLFRPAEDETVAVILNGWFLYHKENWPVSEFVYPLYVSMHVWQDAFFQDYWVGTKFLDGLGGESLRQYGPVGCRDLATMSLMQSKGIPAYFSGCMTLTLPQRPKKPGEKPYACLVDLDEELTDYYRKTLPEGMELKCVKHEEHMVEPGDTWEHRRENVEKLLDLYANASSVVTSRLHCALPCLSQGTPVLLVAETMPEQDRFDGIRELVHTADRAAVLRGESGFPLSAPPENKKDYLTLRNALIETCREFVARAEELPAVEPARAERYLAGWPEREAFKQALLRDGGKKSLQQFQWMQQRIWDLERENAGCLQCRTRGWMRRHLGSGKGKI